MPTTPPITPRRAKSPAGGPRAAATSRQPPLDPTHTLLHAKTGVDARVWVGDCRAILPTIPEVSRAEVDLVFADPPFNWARAYDKWHDNLPEREYLDFTFDWLDLCVGALNAHGSLWVNIPDTWAAEIVCYLKGRLDRKPPHPMTMVNWCVWHYRFGQNATERFINSKVHALYFCRNLLHRRWNAGDVLEASDRASTYFDPRTLRKKDGMPAGQRVPLDVWYGQYWGRIQGNNKERRAYHDNQLPEVYLERVILSTSNPGDLVLDPFLGSGTTGVVAHALGRRFIGTEYSADNARHAVERIHAGPWRTLGEAKGMSTAIFAARKASDRARARFTEIKPHATPPAHQPDPSPRPRSRRA